MSRLIGLRGGIFLFIQLLFMVGFSQEQQNRLTRYTVTKENSFWLDMIDREPILSAKAGIVHDYDSRMDNEYWIDFNSYNFSILDDSRYVESPNAFRAMAGSINSSRFFAEGGFKVFYQVEEKVYFKLNYQREQNYQSDHDVLLVELGRSNLFNTKISFYGNISLETDKEDMDLIAGVKWEALDQLHIDLQLVVLDFLNNALNGSGGISQHQQPEKRMFDRQPFAFRLRAYYEWNDYRFEFFTAADTPEKANITFESREYTDFREEIGYTYFGGKIEKQWTDQITTGFYGNYRAAKHYRIGEDENDYRFREEHSEIGFYSLIRVNEKWRIESDWAFSTMATQRISALEEPNLNTDDWAFYGKTMAFWQFKPRWQLQTGLVFDRRVMTTLLEQYPLDGFNLRLVWGIRYQFQDNFFMLFTNNIGLEDFYSYDGSSIAIQLTW